MKKAVVGLLLSGMLLGTVGCGIRRPDPEETAKPLPDNQVIEKEETEEQEKTPDQDQTEQKEPEEDDVPLKTIGSVQYQVPEDWEESPDLENGVIAYYADGYNLMVQCVDSGFDENFLSVSKDIFVAGIAESLENCSNLESETRSIAGKDAIEIKAGFTANDQEYEWHGNTFMVGHDMYSFVGMTEIGNDYSEEYEAVISSIVIASDGTSKGESQEAASGEPQEIILVASGWSQPDSSSGEYKSIPYAVKIQNPNEDYAVDFPTITITARDEEGKILTTKDQVLNSIAAGDTAYYGNSIVYEGGMPAEVEISVSNSDRDYTLQDDTRYVRQSDFEIFNVSEKSGYTTSFTGEITNNSTANLDRLIVIVIYKQGDSIIGGDVEYLDDLGAGETKPFELTARFGSLEYDSYEFYAMPW